MKSKFINDHLHQLFSNTLPIRLTNDDKIVIFSDLHVGNGSARDDFMINSELFRDILENYYLKNGYKLILNGDVEELQKFSISSIHHAWKELFKLFHEFKNQNGYFKTIGNHDYNLIFKEKYRKHTLPALRMLYEDDSIFIFHGHQASLFYENYNYIATFVLRYLANPLGIKNQSPAYDSKKRYKIEKYVYHFSSQNKLLSIIGHTHRPLFESLSKVDSLKFQIEQLCRQYTIADAQKRKRMERQIMEYKDELKELYAKRSKDAFRSTLYSRLIVPCLFNSGCVIGKRGITGIELSEGKILLVHWFDKSRSEKYLSYQDIESYSLGESNHYRVVLKSENLNYIFTRIRLLS